MLSLFSYNDTTMNNMFRDLSEYENLNVKELLLHHRIEEIQNTKKNTKVEKMKQENLKKKQQKLIDDDKKRLDYYKQFTFVTEEIIEELRNFKTDYGKERMKYKLIQLAVKNEDTPTIIELFLQIIHSEPTNENERKLKKKIQKKMDEIDYKKYQFQHLSNRLPPLDFYNEYQKKLDPWQVDVLNQVDKGQNVLICARTSMGKTWLSMYPALIGKKTLFIVPTKPLAYQVCSVFKKFLNGKTSILVKDYFQTCQDSVVLVGTPQEIERNLPILDMDFEFLVCDEVHNLNNYDGDCYERLIKIFSPFCKFMALSATIGNSHEIKQWFETISGNSVKLIQYSTRFLNHQRHIWSDGTLEKIHPFSCLRFEDITNEFLQKNLPLTPKDNIEIFKCLQKELGKKETADIQVRNIFKEDNKRLTLDDSKYYEDILKKEIIKLKKNNPEKVKEILEKFYKDVVYDDDINLYSLFKQIKNSNLTPCILFQLNSDYCKEIFQKIVYYLENLEKKSHPYYYDNLEYLADYYKKFMEKSKKIESGIKLGKDEDKDKKDQILKEFHLKETQIFQNDFTSRIEKQKKTVRQDTTITSKIKNIQIRNLDKQLHQILETNTIKFYDKFEKHPEFCMNTNEPMTAQTIRTIKKQIQENLKITVEYTNVFMQGLKRGIGIYTEDMPEIYNQIVQSLAQNKQLGFVISDKTLGLGINMGFRSSCIFGYKDSKYFSKNDYEQLIGRAGRRGQDTEGHIIYCDVDWKTLMRGELGTIMGEQNIIYDYNVVTKISKHTPEQISNVFKNFLNKNIPKIDSTNISTTFYDNPIDNKLLWQLKEYKNRSHILINNLDKLEMMYTVNESQVIKTDMYLSFIKLLVFIFKQLEENCSKSIDISHDTVSFDDYYTDYFKEFKSTKFTKNTYIKLTYEILYIIQTIHNLIKDCRYYQNISLVLNNVFKYIIQIINNNQTLN